MPGVNTLCVALLNFDLENKECAWSGASNTSCTSLISYLLRVPHRELDALINLKTLLAVCMYRIAGNFWGDKIFVLSSI